ncbi:hypothetical protein EI94DRAFT_1771963 [Lactarius quietus]|nr:hypothetical protein EI94DRAFT_1771963 [Lactarius quietus]
MIQNGNDIGGGHVIGWLPIVAETPEDACKPAFVQFKCTVWHSMIHVIIKSIIKKSEAHFLCTHLKQQIQCCQGGKLLCPVCLVPADQLSDISRTWLLRDAAQTQGLLKDAQALDKSQGEALLSQHGLRDIDNVFWLVANLNPHHALFGLFGYHLWNKFKLLSNQIGCDAVAQVDQQFGHMPRWRGLNRFPKVMKVSFTDGAKYEDILKIVVFAAHNVIHHKDSEGWQLMCCLQSFSILDLLLSFEVHTNESISAGEEELSRFGDLMKATDQEETEESVKDKNWNFPKMHALVHSFDDVRAKGASQNYNTKPNEKLHGPIKKAYMRTNFKDVAYQKADDDDLETGADTQASRGAQESINLSLVEPPSVGIQTGRTLEAGAIILGSQQQPLALSLFESRTGQESHFINFRHRLSKWLTDMFEAYQYCLPSGLGFKALTISYALKITEYQSMKVCYESMVDSQQYLDYLHCSPKFHHMEWHDFVIVKTTTSFIFAKLLFIFTCSFAENCFPICLVLPLDKPTGKPTLKDQDLRLHCVRASSSTKHFFVQSLVRGAPLVQDFDRVGDYFVMDAANHMYVSNAIGVITSAAVLLFQL